MNTSITVLDEFGEIELPVAPVGKSGIICRDCGEPFTVRDALRFETSDEPTMISGCGHFVDIADYIGLDNVALQHSALPLINKSTETTWFHATRKDSWYDKVLENDVMIHAGDLASATSRGNYLAQGPRRRSDFLVYELRVRDGVKANNYIILDDNDWETNLVNPDQINPYFNMYENIGSISILTHPSLVEVVDINPL